MSNKEVSQNMSGAWMMASRMNLTHVLHDGSDRKYLVSVMVYDIASGMVLGYAHGLSENRWLYESALEKAARSAGYLPAVVLCERFTGHATDEWAATTEKLRQLGTLVVMTGLERTFNNIQNRMWHRATLKGWSMEQAVEAAEKSFEEYNNTPHIEYSSAHAGQTPEHLHRHSDKPAVRQVTDREMMRVFGLCKRVKLRDGGYVAIELLNVKYLYLVPADDWNTIVSRDLKKATAYIDPNDMARVHLYTVADHTEDEQFLCEASVQDWFKTKNATCSFEFSDAYVQRKLAQMKDLTGLANAPEVRCIDVSSPDFVSAVRRVVESVMTDAVKEVNGKGGSHG